MLRSDHSAVSAAYSRVKRNPLSLAQRTNRFRWRKTSHKLLVRSRLFKFPQRITTSHVDSPMMVGVALIYEVKFVGILYQDPFTFNNTPAQGKGVG